MKLIIEKDELAMSESAMHIILGAMMQDKQVNISLTSGKSPIEMYKMMAPRVKDKPQFENIQYWLFDEAPYDNQPHGINWNDMQELFFKDANIPDERIHVLSMDNWETYDREIEKVGGIDVMVIGLGYDGHFCANSPRTTPLDSYSYYVEWDKKVEANPNYAPREHNPYSITMGPKSLMKVKHLVIIVNGAHKAEILKQVLNSPITPELPATVLKLHPNCTLIADADAAALLTEEDLARL